MEFHEAANIFPMGEDHLQELADDIAANGLQFPVECYDGKIIDGRRRFKACELAGIDPDMIDVDPRDPVAYVLSLNLYRRHLTPSQRAMIGARARGMYNKAAKERMKVRKGNQPGATPEKLPELHATDARDAAGKAVGVSGRMVDWATKVNKHAVPEVVKAVDEGRMSVQTAAILASEPSEVQLAEATNPKRNRTYQSVSRSMEDKGETDKGSASTLPHDMTEIYARNMADIAIGQLKRVPKRSRYRSTCFDLVSEWMSQQRRKS